MNILTDFKLDENHPKSNAERNLRRSFEIIRSNKLEVEPWHIFDLYSEKTHMKTSHDRQTIAVF